MAAQRQKRRKGRKERGREGEGGREVTEGRDNKYVRT